MNCGDHEDVGTANLQTMESITSTQTVEMECSQNTQAMQSLDAKECENTDDVCSKAEEKELEKEDENSEREENECKKRKQDECENEKDNNEEEEKKIEGNEDSSDEEQFKKLTFPDTIEGFNYKFNQDGQLRNIETDEPFQFVIKPNDHYYNQKRYEALGEILNEYVYGLLETECNLKKITIPVDADKGEPTSFVFASENAFSTTGKLLILIHGSGVVRAGQWARRLIINDCLDSGTQIPYIKKAMEEGYEVLVLNTNENESKDGKEIRGSETPVNHAEYVFQNLLQNVESPGKHIAIVAHSYGGCVVLSLLEKNLLEKTVFAIAFTDSVHQLQYQLNHPMSHSWIIKRARNWVSSDKDLDESLQPISYKRDVERYSAGTKKHEETSSKAMESVFKYIKSKEPSSLNKKTPTATQKGDVTTDEKTTKEEKTNVDNSETKQST